MQTTVSGVNGTATLSTPLLVCTSNVYAIDTVLLPTATVALVPSVLGATGPSLLPLRQRPTASIGLAYLES